MYVNRNRTSFDGAGAQASCPHVPTLGSLLRVWLLTFGGLAVRCTVCNLLLACLDFCSCLAGCLGSALPWPWFGGSLVVGFLVLCLVLPLSLPLFPLVLGCLPLTCMSQEPSNLGPVELHLSLPGGLRVTITAPADQVLLATRSFNHVAAFDSAGEDTSEFEVVSPTASAAPAVDRNPRRLETRDEIRSSFSPCPGFWINQSTRLCGSATSGKDRVVRAWTAGQWAKAVASARIRSPNRAEPIDLRNRYYAVLRAPGLAQPTIFRSSAGYWRCIGGSLQDSDSISHSFPSELEATVYLRSAGAQDPVFDPYIWKLF